MLSRRSVLAGTGASLALAAVPAGAQGSADAKVTALLDDVADELLRLFPETATGLGLDTGGRAALRGRSTDRSAAGQREIARRLAARVAEFDRVDAGALTPATRIHLDVARTAFETALRGFAFPYGDVAVGGWRNSPYVVIQNVGAYIDTPRLFDVQKLENEADAAAYLARLADVATMLDAETERLRGATATGVIPPAFLLDKAINQLRSARSGDPAAWPWVAKVGERFPARRGQAAALARDRIVPAFDRQIAALQDQRVKAGNIAGVWRLPDGEAYYRWALGAATTTTRTPDDIHAQGRDELKRLQAQMDALLRPLGYTQGSVGARMAALARDPRQLFPNTDAGRAQVIAYAEGRIAAIRPRLPQAFSQPVKGNVEVRRIPLAEEPGAASAYGGPGSLDGAIPGKFWINLSTTARWPRYSIATTTFHEALPGHVWQGEYTQRLPLIRSILNEGFPAYSEGWALYAEQLADELGMYEDDPAGRLGFLQGLAFRACRLVVDTGLHAKRWTREQAIAWFAEANGQEQSEVVAEVERYCSWPGQACAYKTGHSEIVRMREAAAARLGQRFDRRRFNDAVVGAGPMPLTVLGRVVERST